MPLRPVRWIHVSCALICSSCNKSSNKFPQHGKRKLTLVLAFFYPQESAEAVAFHKSQGLGGRLTEVKDIAPLVRFLVTEGGWITGQTLFANGGYTTR